MKKDVEIDFQEPMHCKNMLKFVNTKDFPLQNYKNSQKKVTNQNIRITYN